MITKGIPLWGGSTFPTNRNLVEFRAGKMFVRGHTVSPDTRKGLIYVFQTDDSLMHFRWKDRVTEDVDDDFIIFPDDVRFKRVKQCTTGRVYSLKFNKSKKTLFYWMQEPSSAKDEEICRRVNDLLNYPPPIPTRNPVSSLSEAQLQFLLSRLTEQQFQTLLGGYGSTLAPQTQKAETTVDSSSVTRQPPRKKRNSVKQSSKAIVSPTIVEEVLDHPPTATPSTTPAEPKESLTEMNRQYVDMKYIINSETIEDLLESPDHVSKLGKHIPAHDSPDVKTAIKENVNSQQFRETLDHFSLGLQLGALGSIAEEFNLGNAGKEALAMSDLGKFFKLLEDAMGAHSSGINENNTDITEINDNKTCTPAAVETDSTPQMHSETNKYHELSKESTNEDQLTEDPHNNEEERRSLKRKWEDESGCSAEKQGPTVASKEPSSDFRTDSAHENLGCSPSHHSLISKVRDDPPKTEACNAFHQKPSSSKQTVHESRPTFGRGSSIEKMPSHNTELTPTKLSKTILLPIQEKYLNEIKPTPKSLPSIHSKEKTIEKESETIIQKIEPGNEESNSSEQL